jgi:hypothetical protein
VVWQIFPPKTMAISNRSRHNADRCGDCATVFSIEAFPEDDRREAFCEIVGRSEHGDDERD